MLKHLLGWLGAAVLVACDGGAPDLPVPKASAVTVGSRLAAEQTAARSVDEIPRSLDPSLLTEVDAQQVCDDLFEGLTVLAEDGSVAPGVATDWQVSADGKTWMFHLRANARWSNGDPVTAEDFIYAWRREVDPKTAAEYAQALAPIVGAMAIATNKAAVDTLGAEALDAHTLRVSLVSPTPYFLYVLADSYMQPLHRATVERYRDDWTRPEHMVSNGPFVLKEYIIGDRITVEKNPLYWGADGVHLTRVVWYGLDSLAQVSRFMAGDLQLARDFPSAQYRWLKSQLGDQVQAAPWIGIVELAENMLGPPFRDNRDLRLALSMAVDRTVLADKLGQGLQLPAYSLIPPLPGYVQQVPEWASWSDEKRHAEARRLYAAAGYSAAHPLHVQLDYPTAESNRDMFDAIAAMWRMNLGAQVDPYNEEFRVLLQDLRLHKSALFQNGWIGDFPDPFTFMQLYQTGFEQNFGGNSDAKFDAWLAAAANEPDNARRYVDFERAEDRLNEEAPYIPLMFYASKHLIKPYLKGWHLNVQDRMASRYMYVLEHEGS